MPIPIVHLRPHPRQKLSTSLRKLLLGVSSILLDTHTVVMLYFTFVCSFHGPGPGALRRTVWLSRFCRFRSKNVGIHLRWVHVYIRCTTNTTSCFQFLGAPFFVVLVFHILFKTFFCFDCFFIALVSAKYSVVLLRLLAGPCFAVLFLHKSIVFSFSFLVRFFFY